MAHLPTFKIFCSIILLVLIGSLSVAEEGKELERLLSSDVAIVATLNQAGKTLEEFRDSGLCKMLADIQKEEHPDKPPLAGEFDKLMAHPFVQVLKDKVVLGLVAPAQPGIPPDFMMLAQGDASVGSQLDKILQGEEAQQKLYRLPEQEYQGQKIVVTLHSEKNKISRRFLLVASGVVIASNSLERVKDCYDRLVGQKQDGWKQPLLYQKLDAQALCKVCVDMGNINLDLHKAPKNPLENYPEPAEFFDKARQAVRNTRYLFGSLVIETEKGVHVKIIRERKAESPRLLPNLSWLGQPSDIVNPRTIAFVSVPFPYSLFWYAAKYDGLHKNPRKVRETESRLNELFGWLSFQDEVLPKIGPQTSLLLRLPSKLEGSPVLPYANAIVKVDPGIDFAGAIGKIFHILQQNPQIARHVRLERAADKPWLNRLHLSGTPVDKLLTPAYGILRDWLVIGSDARSMEELAPLLSTPVDTRQQHLYGYVNFQALANLVQMNIPFFKQEAAKKGKPFSEKNVEVFLKLLRAFQDTTVVMESQDDLEVLQVWLHAAR